MRLGGTVLWPGWVVEIDLSPCWDGKGLAGTHPVVLLGINEQTGAWLVAACTSKCPRTRHVHIPRGVVSFPLDTFVLDTFVITSRVRQIESALWDRGRPLFQLPRPYLEDVRSSARPALRQGGFFGKRPSQRPNPHG